MTVLLVVIHVIVCIFLVLVVLLQSGKGAELGAAFGGSSQTLFGSRGAATFLSKATTAAAIIFMLTSLGLTMVTTRGSSVIRQRATVDQRNAVPQQQAPLTPQQAPQKQAQQPVPQKPSGK